MPVRPERSWRPISSTRGSASRTWTIEHRGAIPRERRAGIGDWIFGCDVCQDVCPWNRFAPPAREARLHARALEGWTLERFLELDEPGFARLFATSPIRRAQRGGFLRNVCVALGNRGDPRAVAALTRALADSEPLVRAHAAWALGEIGRRLPPGAPNAAARRTRWIERRRMSRPRCGRRRRSPVPRSDALVASSGRPRPDLTYAAEARTLNRPFFTPIPMGEVS